MSELLEAVLRYANVGFAVFPVEPGGKTPLVKWRDVSTVEPDEIREWWAQWPDANVGIDVGKSKLAVIDVDDLDGLKQLEAEVGQLPLTLMARTGSGGLHYVYRAPNVELRNSASKLAPGIDVRGEGGYVVVPPSRTTGDYVWTHKVEPAPFPPAVLARLAELDRKPERTERVDLIDHSSLSGGTNRWGSRVLEGELLKVAFAEEGQRNHILFSSACKVFEAVKGEHIDEAYAFKMLTSAAERIGLEDEEIEKTLESAWDRVEPRDPQEELRKQPGQPAPASFEPERRDAKAPTTFRAYQRAQLKELPPPTWLIKGLLPEGLTVLWGESSVGKSFVALDWCLTLAHQGKRVLYFAAEGAGAFDWRISAWEAHHRSLAYDDSNLLVVPQVPRLLDPEQREALAATVQEVEPDVTVFDTWQYALVGGDENSTGDSALAVDVMNRLRSSYGTSVIVVHHANKTGDMRGNAVLTNSADAAWRMKRSNVEGVFDAFELGMSKPFKDGERADQILGRLQKAGPSVVPYPTTPQRLGLMR